MNIILFGITGFGNIVLEELINLNHKPKIIITRQEINPDPYLNLPQLSNLGEKHKIPVMFDKTHFPGEFNLCIVATYHLLINVKESNFKSAYNIHPSLLPKFKGKDPIAEVINEKQKFTGVSVHELTDKFDDGKVIYQKKLKIIEYEKKSIMKQMLPIFKSSTREIISKVQNTNHH